MLRITNQLLTAEAQQRGWTFQVVDENVGFITYTLPDGRTYLLRSAITPFLSALSKSIADNKQVFYELASKWGVAVPETELSMSDEQAELFLTKHKKIVAKPQDAAHGNGVTIDIVDTDQLKKAIAYAGEFSNGVLLQQQLTGDDYRLLFIGNKLAAAAIRKPAAVKGDGIHTIQELISAENQRDIRGTNYQTPLNIIDLDAAKRYLGDALSRIPAIDEQVQVVGTANIGTGGYAVDVTDTVSAEMIATATKVVEKLQMPVCGVDFIDDPVHGPKVIEVNASPSLGLHVYPFIGESQPVPKLLLDWLETMPAEQP